LLIPPVLPEKKLKHRYSALNSAIEDGTQGPPTLFLGYHPGDHL
jgi:hypothetical protein